MSRVQQSSVKVVFFKLKVVVAGIGNLFIGSILSLFSLGRVRRFIVMTRSLLGKFCLDSKQNFGIRKGSPEIYKSPGQAEKYDCNCG